MKPPVPARLALRTALDLALYDGNPFEYATHCTGVVIEGALFEGERTTEIGQ